MSPLSAAEISELVPVLCLDVIVAIADRPNASQVEREAVAQEALRQIEAYEPKTRREIMLAGQAVLFQSLALDAVHDARRMPLPSDARVLRQQAVAMGRMQLSYVKELQRGAAATGEERKAVAPARTVEPVAEKAAAPARVAEPAAAANAEAQGEKVPVRGELPRPAVPPVSPRPVAAPTPHVTGNGAAHVRDGAHQTHAAASGGGSRPTA